MSNQQNPVEQATSDNFSFAAIQNHNALVVNDCGPFLDFAYRYEPQESVYTSEGGLQPDSDAGNSFSAPCPTGSGSTNYSQYDLSHEIVKILYTMKNMLRENFLTIKELLRKMDDLQKGRAASFGSPPTTDSTTAVPPFFPVHDIPSIDANPSGPSELWSHYGIRPGSFSSARVGPYHNNLPITATARASSVPTDICMDSEDTVTQSPSFREVVESPSSRFFLCECGHQTKSKGDMQRHHETLKHTQRKYTCPCGANYTRGDGLKRHQRSCKGNSLV